MRRLRCSLSMGLDRKSYEEGHQHQNLGKLANVRRRWCPHFTIIQKVLLNNSIVFMLIRIA